MIWKILSIIYLLLILRWIYLLVNAHMNIRYNKGEFRELQSEFANLLDSLKLTNQADRDFIPGGYYITLDDIMFRYEHAVTLAEINRYNVEKSLLEEKIEEIKSAFSRLYEQNQSINYSRKTIKKYTLGLINRTKSPDFRFSNTNINIEII